MRGGLTRADRAALVRSALANATGGGGYLRAPCPICVYRVGSPDRHRALSINGSSGWWHCFRCSAKGRLWGEDAENASRRCMVVDIDPSVRREAQDLPAEFMLISEEPAASALAAEAPRRYLAGRGLSPEVLRAAGVGVCLSGLRWGGRVVVPVLSGEELMGYVGRIWTKKPADPDGEVYRYPHGMPRGEVIYNGEALLVETDTPALVVEGVFDALAPGLWPDGVALLGTHSDPQVEALSVARRPVVFVLDGDAHETGWALAFRLRLEGARAGFVRLPPRTDPDEVPGSWLREEARRSLDAPL